MGVCGPTCFEKTRRARKKKHWRRAWQFSRKNIHPEDAFRIIGGFVGGFKNAREQNLETPPASNSCFCERISPSSRRRLQDHEGVCGRTCSRFNMRDQNLEMLRHETATSRNISLHPEEVSRITRGFVGGFVHERTRANEI